MIPLRRTLPGLLCAILVVAVGGSGCREAPSVRIDLTSYLPVARTASLSKRQRGLAALEPDASGRSFEQPAGVALSWYFALPRAAVLRGRARLLEPSDHEGGAATELRIILNDGGGTPHVLRTAPAAALRTPEGMELVAPLDAWSGRPVRLRLELTGTVGRLAWRDLRIEGLASEQAPGPAPVPRRRSNVLLVLFDTLRADHTEPYGAASGRTPTLARLASRGVTFENATANASWTSPSIASMFTSVYPWAHGVGGSPKVYGSRLHPALPYLPELLSSNGYATMAILHNPLLGPQMGYGRGFETIVLRYNLRPRLNEREHDDPRKQADFLWSTHFEPFLESRGEKPFFVFLHELDPHHPYDPPAPFDTMFTDEANGGPPSFERFKDFYRYKARPGLLSDADLRHLQGLYEGEIGFMDRYLGRILERVEEAGLADDTLVVFTSDHGEMLGEHDGFGHGSYVYEQVRRVPLILSLPGVLPEGKRPRVHAELVDVTPTLLDLLGIDPPAGLRGQSLLPFAFAAEDLVPDRATFSRAHFEKKFSREVVRFRQWKLVHEMQHADEGGERFLLYDLSNDAGELVNRWRSEPVVGGTLRQLLEWRRYQDTAAREALGDAPEEAPPELDAESLEQLRALGYAE